MECRDPLFEVKQRWALFLPGVAGILPGFSGILSKFSGILPGFSGILSKFSGILPGFSTKQKLWAYACTPLLLHHCLQLSYFLTWRKIRNLIFVKQHRIALASCEILQFVRKTDICFYYFLLLLFVQNVEIRSKSVVKASYAINLHRSKESRIFTYLLLHLWED